MKNIFITVAVLLGLAFGANAQDKKIGLKIGTNFSELTDLDAKFKLGLVIGATYTYSLNDVISIQPELVFSSQGASEIIYDGKDITLNYLNIPIIGQYKLSFLKGVSIEFGPQFGFLLSGKNGNTDLKVPSAFDVTLGLGASYQINEDINLGLRANIGLTDTDIIDLFNPNANITNQVIQFTLGYKIF